MARIDDISAEIKAAFLQSPKLQQAYGFDPNRSFDEQFSELSVEAADIELFASVQSIIEAIVAADKSSIQQIIDSNRIGSKEWYVKMVKQFQWKEGKTYNLEVDPETGKIGYPEVVPEDRIITQASCSEDDNGLLILVATGDRGALKPITAVQELNLNRYITKLKVAGVRARARSLPADLLELSCDVYYNPAFNDNNLKEEILQALHRYSTEIDFNGTIMRNAVIDAIQSVNGVADVEIKSLIGIQGENRTPIARSYAARGGYFNIKTTDGFPKINLTPQW